MPSLCEEQSACQSSTCQSFVRVIPATKLERPLIYRLAHSSQRKPGLLVRIPLAKRTITGAIVEQVNMDWVQQHEPKLNIDKIRIIDTALDEKYSLTEEQLDLVFWCSRYYHCALGAVLSAFLPKSLLDGKPVEKPLPAIWKTLLTKDQIDDIKAAKQKALLHWLARHPSSTTAQILTEGFGRHLISVLTKKELIINTGTMTKVDASSRRILKQPELSLSEEQRGALTEIEIAENQNRPFLLNGVTGSGKTEIYLQKARIELEKNRQILFLVPEIGLIEQTVKRVQARFNLNILAFHSNSSEGEKIQCWHSAKQDQPIIVVGTRSSIFLPFANLGLIIIDEEHDPYKQQEGFRYHTRDIALLQQSAKATKKAGNPGLTIILGSATPSIEALYNVERGLFQPLQLNKRVGDRILPSWHYCKPAESKSPHPINTQIIAAIANELEQRNQVLIFINRRGYAPKIQCTHCPSDCMPLLPEPLLCHLRLRYRAYRRIYESLIS